MLKVNLEIRGGLIMEEWIGECGSGGEIAPARAKRRHAEIHKSQVDELESKRNEWNTVKQTKWAVNCLQDWCAAQGVAVDFKTVSKARVNAVLGDFYATVRNGKGELYSLSSFVGIRAGLNRHFNDPPLCRSWCIFKEASFKTSNKVFAGVVKTLRKKGLDTPVHHASISRDDLEAIRKVLDPNTPEGLVNKVWFDVQLHLGRRGNEGHRQLKPTSFTVKRDERRGVRYATLVLNEHTNHHHDDSRAGTTERTPWVMLEQPDDPLCPVSSLEKYLSHLPSDAPAFYLHPRRKVRCDRDGVW